MRSDTVRCGTTTGGLFAAARFLAAGVPFLAVRLVVVAIARSL
jgi:hypothetical protein